jgi:hypothetical protein
MISEPDNEAYSRYRRRLTVASVGIGVGGFVLAYLAFFKANQFVVRLNGHVTTYHRVDYPGAFNAAAAALLLFGAYHFIQGIRFIVGKGPKATRGAEVMGGETCGVRWGIFNAVLLLLFTCLGYSGLTLEILRRVESKWALLAGAFVAAFFVVLSRLHFAAVSTFRKPQWARSPLNWAHDPPQSFFIETCCFAGLALGTILHLFLFKPVADKASAWSLFVYVAAVAGLLVGQAVAYVRYRNQICTESP